MIIGSAVVAFATRWAFLPLAHERIDTTAGAAATILAVAAVACFVVYRRDRETARLREVTSVAETAQRAVLRPPPATVGPFRIAASYRAAAQYARIGGDLYAVADTDHGVRALIGDVRGKGLDAVATASAVLGSFHEAAYDRPNLDGLAHRLETSLHRHLDDVEAFVTAFLVEIHPDGRTHALSCGHPAPLILNGDTVLELPVPPGLPLGLRNPPPDPDAPRTSAATADTRLQPGDSLLMYTDGLTEARDVAGDFYPSPAASPTICAPTLDPSTPAPSSTGFSRTRTTTPTVARTTTRHCSHSRGRPRHSTQRSPPTPPLTDVPKGGQSSGAVFPGAHLVARSSFAHIRETEPRLSRGQQGR
ncbi:PP2C family protein-serine/threonine phosphatase [Streptomyces chiangmaiensis]